jgi:hypothetical protein
MQREQKNLINDLREKVTAGATDIDLSTAAEKEAIRLARLKEFDELTKDIESEYINFQSTDSKDKSVPLARAEAIYSILSQSHDEIWKDGDLNDRRDKRIAKSNANKTLTRMKIENQLQYNQPISYLRVGSFGSRKMGTR